MFNLSSKLKLVIMPAGSRASTAVNLSSDYVHEPITSIGMHPGLRLGCKSRNK